LIFNLLRSIITTKEIENQSNRCCLKAHVLDSGEVYLAEGLGVGLPDRMGGGEVLTTPSPAFQIKILPQKKSHEIKHFTKARFKIPTIRLNILAISQKIDQKVTAN